MRKTLWLMICLVIIFAYVGHALGGESGMINAFWAACGINLVSYFFSDSIVLKQYRATAADKSKHKDLYEIVSRLAKTGDLPMPKIYIIPESVPNAFATGRNPKHAAVAVTQGLLHLMSKEEIEGVLAHEMSHVKHFDILISSVAAVFAGAITMLINLTKSSATAPNSSAPRRVSALAFILMPLAATIIQMSISRTREYKADEGAARLTNHPEWLISALSKLEDYSKNTRLQNANNQTAHLFIVNPLGSFRENFSSLFSTHPSTKERIKRLTMMMDK